MVHSWTSEPISFVCGGEEGPEGIIQSLEMALRDARNRPVLELTADDKIVPEINIPQPRSTAGGANGDSGVGGQGH